MTNKVGIIFLIFCELFSLGTVNSGCANEARCIIARVHGKKAADCFKREFKQFPKCLSTDVEAIELTSNRIRKISRSDLTPFSYLQFLYLQDNLIFKLDDDVFTDMDNLITLDLSLNAIAKLPASIFQLPSLTTLYLSQNVNMNIIDALESARPILSPLERVDISFTTDEDNINGFPNFGPVPFLVRLNITGNQYISILRQNFMGLCSLKKLVNDNVTSGFHEACECVRINRWLTQRNVQFIPFVCSVREADCPHIPETEEELAVLHQCEKTVETREREYRMMKIYIGLGVAGTILVLSVLFYCLVYRKKCANKRKDSVDKNEPKEPPDNCALLNNHTKAVPNEYEL